MSGFGTQRKRPNEPPTSDPVGYLITWSTYGTWLPGDERGWVDRGKGLQHPNPVYRDYAASLLAESPCLFDAEQRVVVEATIAQHCRVRNWQLHAVNCRTNHVHVVVSGLRDPSEMREQLKAWCTRKLKELQAARQEPAREKWWTERGCDQLLGDDESLECAVIYVRDCQ